MRIRIPTLVLVASLYPVLLSAQEVEDRRSAQQIADSAAIASLAHEITAEAVTDSVRAAALYAWVAQNVQYDAAEFFRGGKGSDAAEEVFRHRVALCGGFVALYHRMAREIGLRTVPIAGYAKGVDYVFGRSTRRSNHAWIALHLAGEWRLVDPTWGAGVIIERRFEPRFTWDFFLVPPDQLILSHFPEEEEWQLLDRPLPRRDFERMRAVPRTLLEVGFAPAAIRATALTPGVVDFPLAGPQGRHVRVVNAPMTGTLRAATQVSFEVEWPGAVEVALVADGAWTRLDRIGTRFSGAIVAAGTSVTLVGRTGASGPFVTLLHYRVEGAGRAGAATR